MSRFVRAALKHVGEGTIARPVKVAGREVYPQKNKWACGPWALRHCFLKLGFDFDPYVLVRKCGSTRAGTGDEAMRKGAYACGFFYRNIDVETASEAKRQINRLLKKGYPLILSVEKWQHWVACLHVSSRGYLVFDSSRPGPVIQLWSWHKLKKRLRYVDARGELHYSISLIQRPK